MNMLTDAVPSAPPDPLRVYAAFQGFSNDCSQDPELRARVASEPEAVLAERGMEMPAGVEIRVLANTDDTYYLAFPPDPNVALGDEMLDQVAGGKTVSSAGSAGSASTAGTACTTVSTAGSASSVGSAGSGTS